MDVREVQQNARGTKTAKLLDSILDSVGLALKTHLKDWNRDLSFLWVF